MTEYEEVYSRSKKLSPIGTYHAREAAISKYGFGILSNEAVCVIKACTGPVGIVEVGAGSGYWAYELKKVGVDIVATDPTPISESKWFEKTWTNIEECSGLDALARYPDRDLLICWPDDYNSEEGWSDKVLEAFKGELVFYCGEAYGGCTGSSRFHDLLEHSGTWRLAKTVRIPNWPGVHDQLEVYQRVIRP